MRVSRAALRVVKSHLIREYNMRVLDAASAFQPDMLLAFKGTYVTANTLRKIRARGIALYNYYPDRMVFACGTLLEDSIPEYDCVFDTKRLWDGDTGKRISVRNLVFIPHGYDSEIHHPVQVNEGDNRQYGCEVGVVATHMPVKEQVLDQLLQVRPRLGLNIWGGQWGEYCRSERVKNCVRGTPLTGTAYTKAILCMQVNLGLMGVDHNAKDETSTRTYEIPACGGFMLHERSKEVLELYQEGREVACFESVQELAEKIDYYLAHREEREAIARAGHARCVPAYSYDNRVAEILRWHQQVRGTIRDAGRPELGASQVATPTR